MTTPGMAWKLPPLISHYSSLLVHAQMNPMVPFKADNELSTTSLFANLIVSFDELKPEINSKLSSLESKQNYNTWDYQSLIEYLPLNLANTAMAFPGLSPLESQKRIYLSGMSCIRKIQPSFNEINILDFCCGIGVSTAYLHEMLQPYPGYVNMVAMDNNPFTLSLAMVAHDHPKFFAHAFPNDFVKYELNELGNGNVAVDYENGYFDVVNLSYVLNELKQDEIVKLLMEIRRVLKNNGIILVMQRTRDNLDWMNDWMRKNGFEDVSVTCPCNGHCFISAKKQERVKTRKILIFS